MYGLKPAMAPTNLVVSFTAGGAEEATKQQQIRGYAHHPSR